MGNMPAFASASMRSIQNEPVAVAPAGQTLRIPLNRSGYLVGGVLSVAFDFSAAPGSPPTPGALINSLAISKIRLSSAGTTDYFRMSGYSAFMYGATRDKLLTRGDVGSLLEASIASRYAYLNQSSSTRYWVHLNLRNILGELELFSLLDTEGTGGLILEIDTAPAAAATTMTGYTQASAFLTTERRLYPLNGAEPPYQGLVKTVIETVVPIGAAPSTDNFTLPQIGMVGGVWLWYQNVSTGAPVVTEIGDYQIQFGSISAPYKELGRAKLVREEMEEDFLLPSGVHRFDFLSAAGDVNTMPHTRDTIQVVDATDVRLQINFDAAASTWPANSQRVLLMEVFSPAVAG